MLHLAWLGLKLIGATGKTGSFALGSAWPGPGGARYWAVKRASAREGRRHWHRRLGMAGAIVVARRSSPPLSVRHPSTVIQCHRGRCWWWWLLTCLLLVSPCACALLLPLPRPSTLNLHCAAAQGVAPVRTTKADKQTSHSRAWFPLTTTTSFLNLLFSLTTLATHHPVGRRTVAHRCLQLLLQDSPCDVVCHFALDTSSSHGSSDIRGERSVQPAPQPDRHSRSAISQTFGTVGHLAS